MSSFRWAQVPVEVLRALVERPDASAGDASAELALLYGARPQAGFVADRWAVLRDAWLAAGDDPHTADAIVALRTAGLGDLAIDITTAAGTSAYLASCADSLRLRSVVLQAFLAAGGATDAAPVAAGGDAADADGTSGDGTAEDAPIVVPVHTADELRTAVIGALGALFGAGDNGAGEVVVDDDGDIPIRWGSAVLYVRVLEDNPVVRIFSPLLREVALTDDVREAVNELNKNHLFVSAFWADGVVLLTADAFAAPFVPQQFLNLLHAVAETADSIDDQLRTQFAAGGPSSPGSAGYL